MSTACIIVAGGSGTRMKCPQKKQYIKINDKEIIRYTLDNFENHNAIDEIIIVVAEGDNIDQIKKHYKKIKSVVTGGATRQHSVYNALKVLNPSCTTVLVHDAVRPFVSSELIDCVIKTRGLTGACIPAVKATDTIKKIDDSNIVTQTPDRNYLVNVQTPQCYDAKILISAYEKAFAQNFLSTDDSALVERIGINVAVCEGSIENIKITTPLDLKIASVILESQA